MLLEERKSRIMDLEERDVTLRERRYLEYLQLAHTFLVPPTSVESESVFRCWAAVHKCTLTISVILSRSPAGFVSPNRTVVAWLLIDCLVTVFAYCQYPTRITTLAI